MNLLKAGSYIINLDQLNYADQEPDFTFLYFEGSRKVEFEGEEAEKVWKELERRSDEIVPPIPPEDLVSFA